MTINYGKREAGSLTAAAPGDTLYIPFSAFNDSGASIALTGLAVTDIEVFKNGSPVPRATDSGYSLISDTGMAGDRPGLYRFSLSLYNTSDDTGFFDAGSQYHVAVDAVTVDARNVRFYPAVFEIGTQTANIVAVRGDTGAAHLDQGRLGVISDSGRMLDTGKVASAVWTSHATRGLTNFAFDTGVADTVWKASGSAYTDTGSLGYMIDNPAAIDTGLVNRAVWNGDASRTLTSFLHDTGVADTVWKSSHSSYAADTGSLGYGVGTLQRARGDTGVINTSGGRLSVTGDSGQMAAVLDTGKVAAAVWANHATRVLSSFPHDTGVADTVWKSSGSAYADTGSVGYMIDNPPATAIDTGQVNRAVWNADATRTLTALGPIDTGIAGITVAGVTGVVTANVDQIDGDTGAADVLGKFADQLRGDGTFDTGTGLHDTGEVAAAVWAYATRVLTANTNLSIPTAVEVAGAVWDEEDTGHQVVGTMGFRQVDTGQIANAVFAKNTNMSVNVNQIDGDTGAADVLGKFATKLSAAGQVDTGTLAGTQAGTIDANVTYVNETAVTGTGAPGDEWGP